MEKEEDIASNYNLSKTLNYLINSYNYKLHFRIYSNNNNINSNFKSYFGVIFWVHGFGGHSNRTEIQLMSNYFNLKGFIIISLGYYLF